jgi:hypothetical protein
MGKYYEDVLMAATTSRVYSVAPLVRYVDLAS